MRPVRLAVLLAALAAALPAPARAALPPVKHVFVIILENHNYDEVYGPSLQAPYLAHDLTGQGQLLTQYYAIGHESLGNYLALLSGQAPNPYTQADAPAYVDFLPGTPAADGQVTGQGAVYPATVQTVANELNDAGLTWRGYMQDMGNAAGQPQTCRHPAPGAPDDTQSARQGDQYAARHNPFVYFHAIIDTPACAANDVPLDRLPNDLISAATTPNFSFISPNLCDDGHDAPCVDGAPGGLVSADAFLKEWVPRITGSPAFQEDGLLIVTFDEARSSSSGDAKADSSGCCNEQPGPNTLSPGGRNPGPGGGRVPAILISRFIKPGTLNSTPYNHYALLRSVQDIFGLRPYLGYAGQAGLRSFGDDVFNNPAGIAPNPAPTGGGAPCRPKRLPAARRGRFRRGALIERLAVRRGTRPRLSLRLTHSARVYVRARRGRRAHTVIRSAKACRTYTVRLPFRHGRLSVAASTRGGTERRGLGALLAPSERNLRLRGPFRGRDAHAPDLRASGKGRTGPRRTPPQEGRMSPEDLRELLGRVEDPRDVMVWSMDDRRTLPELHDAWIAARADAGDAYIAWCKSPGREAYAVYRAAADRADAAAAALAVRRRRDSTRRAEAA